MGFSLGGAASGALAGSAAGPWGAIGGGVLGGFFGGSDNKADVNSAFAANQANIEEAQRNRDWQERMSNTAYQRQRKDLEAAGYNPILGIAGGGASTPSGSMAVSHNTREGISERNIQRASVTSQSALNAASVLKLKADANLSNSMSQTQATQQVLNLANAKQAGFNSQSRIPGTNIPFSVFGINAQNARGAAGALKNFVGSGFKSFGDA